MKQKIIQIQYAIYEKASDLEEVDKMLIDKAIEIAKKSYSPYSKFPVGAAVLLENGAIYMGNNQENIAFPSGTCAERTVLNYVHGNFPNIAIRAMAITALQTTTKTPVTPCGFCRQVMVEMERLQSTNIRVLLHKIGGITYAFDSTTDLLPFSFEEQFLK